MSNKPPKRKFESATVQHLYDRYDRYDRYVANDPKRMESFEVELLNAEIARKTRGAFTEIGFHHALLEPLQHAGRDDEFFESGGHAFLDHLFTHVRFFAFAPMSGAVVVDVLLLFQLTHQTAIAMSATHK